MARIKVKDLPRNHKIGIEELKRLKGGFGPFYLDTGGGESKDNYGRSWIDILSFSPRSVFFDKTRSVIHKIY